MYYGLVSFSCVGFTGWLFTATRLTAERKNSGAPGTWLTTNRMAKTGVACDALFGDALRSALYMVISPDFLSSIAIRPQPVQHENIPIPDDCRDGIAVRFTSSILSKTSSKTTRQTLVLVNRFLWISLPHVHLTHELIVLSNDCRQALRAPGSGQTDWLKPGAFARNC